METVRTVRKARGKLIYTLFREETDKQYGISVTSFIFGTPETAEARKLTADLSAAESILRMLAENDVLPSLLVELTEECTAVLAL